jgi:hypothetical protein
MVWRRYFDVRELEQPPMVIGTNPPSTFHAKILVYINKNHKA